MVWCRVAAAAIVAAAAVAVADAAPGRASAGGRSRARSDTVTWPEESPSASLYREAPGIPGPIGRRKDRGWMWIPSLPEDCNVPAGPAK